MDFGNPGKEYENTRHNMGYAAVDKLSEKLKININKKKFKGIIGEGIYNGEKILLLKPETYMNLSGESIREISEFYKIDTSKELIVAYDDIDIDFGKIRIKPNGSSGTHNGIRNIISMINTEKFIRIRIGTSNPPPEIKLVDYVMMHFKNEEKQLVEEATNLASDAIIEILENGVGKAMNKYN